VPRFEGELSQSWIAEAKREETAARRVQPAIEVLRADTKHP
jgi:hypothetical protein